MLKTFLKWILKKCGFLQNTPCPPSQPDPSTDFFDLPPNCTPIDSVFETERIPDTNLDIGKASRVIETPQGERIELNQRRGVQAGCEHYIWQSNFKTTPETYETGLGGNCIFCQSEAIQLYSQNLIDQRQLEEKSIFCSACQSYCMLCLRQNLCLHHTRLHQTPDGLIMPLCPICFEEVNKYKLLKKTLSVMLSPFVE